MEIPLIFGNDDGVENGSTKCPFRIDAETAKVKADNVTIAPDAAIAAADGSAYALQANAVMRLAR
ncbi:MAG: hypothetical protein AAGH53_08710 [Pseudomonadota bacterium]